MKRKGADMFAKIYEEIEAKVREADMVLLGIGKELDSVQTEKQRKEESSKNYIINEVMQTIQRDDHDFYDRCNIVYHKLHGDIVNQALCNLAGLVKGKNYFLISTNVDECLYHSGFKEGRVLTPCGRESFFQCSENCSDSVWEAAPYLEQIFKNGEMMEETAGELPVCPVCGKRADFNMMKPTQKKQYCEKGYLADWERYKKWLSGTLNKKLLLLDLGTDFFEPQLIRWAFERTAMLNQKAYLIRIHETLANIPEELTGKAASFSVNSRKLFDLI
jgi:hypothetical protein